MNAYRKQIESWIDARPLCRVFMHSLMNAFNLASVQRASTLTYYTALSIVPVLAVLFGVAKGFGVLSDLDQDLTQRFAEHKTIYDYASENAKSLLEVTNEGILTVIGALTLFWAVIKIFTHIELAFNQIWHVEYNRSLVRRVADYIALIVLFPLLLILLSGTVWFSLRHMFAWTPGAVNLLGPVAMTSLIIVFAYKFIPNCRVNWSAAFLGGIAAGTSYQIVQYVILQLQVGVSSYNAIYGSFAAVPLFLFWLQLSWIIVLAGAEMAQTWQYREDLASLLDKSYATPTSQLAAAVAVTRVCIDRFREKQVPYTIGELAEQTGVPQVHLKPIADQLIKGRILSETQETGYTPGRPIDEIRLLDVADCILGPPPRSDGKSATHHLANQSLIKLHQKISELPENHLVRSLSSN